MSDGRAQYPLGGVRQVILSGENAARAAAESVSVAFLTDALVTSGTTHAAGPKFNKYYVGAKFGRWTVIDDVPVTVAGNRLYSKYRCRCVCGTERLVFSTNLAKLNGCGCHITKHGDNPVAGRAAEYSTWSSIIQRCTNPKHINFNDYGGRGITICDEWRTSYPAFLAAVGRRPTRAHTIDRIDNALGYQPGNVRWATKGDQSRNRRDTLLICLRGEAKCATDWARITGVARSTIREKLKRGITKEEIFGAYLVASEAERAAS